MEHHNTIVTFCRAPGVPVANQPITAVCTPGKKRRHIITDPITLEAVDIESSRVDRRQDTHKQTKTFCRLFRTVITNNLSLCLYF
jgi:hypothetical protein